MKGTRLSKRTPPWSRHLWGSPHLIPELQLTFPGACVLLAPQIQFVPKISFPPQTLSFSYLPHVDTARFLAAQGQDLFLILCILHVTKTSYYYFLFEVVLESVSSSHPPLHSSGPGAPSSPPLLVLALRTLPLEHRHTLLTSPPSFCPSPLPQHVFSHCCWINLLRAQSMILPPAQRLQSLPHTISPQK